MRMSSFIQQEKDEELLLLADHYAGDIYKQRRLEEESYSILDKTLNDPRLNLETVFTSWTGTAITVTTASISILSSCLIIFVILRSPTGLASIYHRLMLSLSCASILQSCAMAFTTLPMPTDMIYDQFDGLVLGNVSSCSFQAFCFNTGFHATTFYTIFLIYYYLFALHFCMSDATFSKYIEPVMHVFAVLFSLIVSILSWTFDLMHPSPLYPFCVTTSYPYWCKTKNDCLNGELSEGRVAILYSVSTLTLAIMSVNSLIALAVIVCSIYSREQKFKSWIQNNNIHKDENQRASIETAKNHFARTKNVIRQSFYYICAFMAVYIFPIINLFSDTSAKELPKILDNKVFQMAYVIIRPSQGTLYLLIFLYHKIWKLQKTYPSLSFFEGFKEVVFRRGEAQDKIVSRIELVVRDNARGNLHLAKDQEQDDDSSKVHSIDAVNNADYADHHFKIDTPQRASQVPKNNSVVEEKSYVKSIYGAEAGGSSASNIFSVLFGQNSSFGGSGYGGAAELSSSNSKQIYSGNGALKSDVSIDSNMFSTSTQSYRNKKKKCISSSSSSVYVSKEGFDSFDEDRAP